MTLDLENDADSTFDQLVSKYVKNKYHTSIVVPAYNEENRIGPFLRALNDTLPENTEIIVVFDGNDNTPEIVRSFGERMKLIQFSRRLGKGGAILEGFKRAKGEVVGFVDADGAIPASEVLRLSSLVTERNSCVIGSRWVQSSRIGIKEPTLNVLAGRVFHYFVYLILGLKVKDTQCGIKFFHKSILQALCKKVTISNRMIDIAILYHVKLMKRSIQEIGIEWNHAYGSKLPIWKVMPLMFATLLGLRLIHSGRFGNKFFALSKINSEISEY